MPRVLLIIVTYQAEQWLATCMGAVRALQPRVDLAVVDNASTDATRALLQAYAPFITYYYPLKSNVGFGKAHNLVFSQPTLANYDYVFLLNQDAYLDRPALDRLIELADAHPHYGVISPVHYRSAEELDIRFASYLGGHQDAPLVEVTMANAALWLLRRAVIDDIGYFNPIFPHYGEDVNYLARLRQAGYRVGVAPQVRGYHYRPATPLTPRLDQSPYQFWVIGLLRFVDPDKSTLTALRQTLYDYFRLLGTLLLRGRLRDIWQHGRYLLRTLADLPRYPSYRKLRIFTTGVDHSVLPA